MPTKLTDLFFKGVSYWRNVFGFHGFLSLCWIFRSPTVGFVNFPCSQTSDPVSFLDDTDRFWGWWYIPNCQILNKLPRSSSFVVSILYFRGYWQYQLSKLAWKHGRPEVIYSISIGEKGCLHQPSSGVLIPQNLSFPFIRCYSHCTTTWMRMKISVITYRLFCPITSCLAASTLHPVPDTTRITCHFKAVWNFPTKKPSNLPLASCLGWGHDHPTDRSLGFTVPQPTDWFYLDLLLKNWI